MAKVKYYYDTKTLSYKRIELSKANKIKNLFYFLVGSAFTGLAMGIIFLQFFDSPKEKILNREIKQLSTQYEAVQDKLKQVEVVLDDIQQRDDNIYRVIFEAEPISKSIREAGFGGINRYASLEGFNNSDLIIETSKKLDKISKQLYIQSTSFDEVIELAKNKTDMLESMPAIQPISNSDLTRVASGFGYRIHPIYKTSKLHTGMDFTAPRGTPVYATGKGKVTKVVSQRRGYGKHIVIDHGYGYETLYAHLNGFDIYKGQKVQRGDIIGSVGSTGTSTSPHLHYEVHKNGIKINPVNFYYNDLDPEEYEEMIKISSQSHQTFD